ncbi:MAG TPA: hypothetical protein VHX13_07395 [Acidobacteriaceae bacterium]|jgi:hypothetical protein|nr:hypothetical protein [Acidobacteriaceae bacterium]
MKRFLCLALAFLPLATGCAHRVGVAYAPPPAYTDVAHQGYADGARAAQRDLHNGVRPDVDRHPRFRNPPVPPPLRDDYRHGFRDGYARVMHGGPGAGY